MEAFAALALDGQSESSRAVYGASYMNINAKAAQAIDGGLSVLTM